MAEHDDRTLAIAELHEGGLEGRVGKVDRVGHTSFWEPLGGVLGMTFPPSDLIETAEPDAAVHPRTQRPPVAPDGGGCPGELEEGLLDGVLGSATVVQHPVGERSEI